MLLSAAGAPESTDGKIREYAGEGDSHQQAPVARVVGVAGAGAPEIDSEEEGEEAEEEAGDFEPEDAANAAEGANEASQTATGCSGVFVRGLADLADFFRILGNRCWPADRVRMRGCGLLARLRRRAGSRGILSAGRLGRPFLGALLGDASCDAYANAQFFSYLVRVHPHPKSISALLALISHILCGYPVAVAASQK